MIIHVNGCHPFSLFYHHHLGFFPRCHPPEWDSVRGLGFRLWQIGHHRRSDLGAGSSWQCLGIQERRLARQPSKLRAHRQQWHNTVPPVFVFSPTLVSVVFRVASGVRSFVLVSLAGGSQGPGKCASRVIQVYRCGTVCGATGPKKVSLSLDG